MVIRLYCIFIDVCDTYKQSCVKNGEIVILGIFICFHVFLEQYVLLEYVLFVRYIFMVLLSSI